MCRDANISRISAVTTQSVMRDCGFEFSREFLNDESRPAQTEITLMRYKDDDIRESWNQSYYNINLSELLLSRWNCFSLMQKKIQQRLNIHPVYSHLDTQNQKCLICLYLAYNNFYQERERGTIINIARMLSLKFKRLLFLLLLLVSIHSIHDP